MNKTLSFARLDYITIKPYLTLKNLLIFLFVFIFTGYGTGELAVPIVMLMMYSTIYASYPFAVGDKNGIDTLYVTLPIMKNNIVTGRYVFTLCLNLIMSIVAFAISGFLTAVSDKAYSWAETSAIVLSCFALFSIVEAIQLPIYFKLGYAKAKFLAYLPLLAFPAAVMSISAFIGKETLLPLIENIIIWIQENSLFAITLFVLMWILIMLGSWLLSYCFYKKREF